LAICPATKILANLNRREKMRNTRQIFVGIAILTIGLIALIGALFDVDLGRFLCPTVLILAGVWLLVRPRTARHGTAFTTRLLGGVRRRGDWQVTDEEITLGVGDIELDMVHADIPPGETRIRASGFVNGVRLIVPEGVGVAVTSMAFLTEVQVFDQKYTRFFDAGRFASEDYETAERKVNLDLSCFVVDVKVKRAPGEVA
jgi:predicted membrane protein